MNLNLASILQLIQLGINILDSFVKGNPTALEQALLDLTKAGSAAYTAQTGKPIDPALIQPIDPIP